MAKAKVKASKTLLAWSSCRLAAGIKPGKKMSKSAKRKVSVCVDKKIGK